MTIKTRVVLFGTGPVASVVRSLLEHDSPYEVAAMTADREYAESAVEPSLEVVPFDEVAGRLPPADFGMFVAVGFSRMNSVRADRCRQAQDIGYQLIRHVSSRASVWPDLQMGSNSLIMEGAIIGPGVTIGDDCIIWPGAYVGHGATIGDHCYLAARSSVSGLTTIGPRCVIGTAAIVRDQTTVGEACVVGAGAVVTRDLEANSIVAAPHPRSLPGRSDRLPNL